MLGQMKENNFVIVIKQVMIYFCNFYSFWPSQMDVTGPILDIGDMGVFLGHVFKKGHLLACTP